MVGLSVSSVITTKASPGTQCAKSGLGLIAKILADSLTVLRDSYTHSSELSVLLEASGVCDSIRAEQYHHLPKIETGAETAAGYPCNLE